MVMGRYKKGIKEGRIRHILKSGSFQNWDVMMALVSFKIDCLGCSMLFNKVLSNLTGCIISVSR